MKTETHSLAWIAQTIGPQIGPVGVCANPHCSVGSLVELHEDGEDVLKSWREIAEELGIPEDTCYQTGMRALTKMRQAIGEDNHA